MRILMINSVCGIRSTGRICTDLATALEAQEHEVKIAYGREHVPEQFQKYAVRIGSDLDVKLHGAKARLFDASGFGSKQATKRFINWVKEYDPDVIHLHNIHGYYINIEILFNYLKTCGKKIIWTLHDCWAFTGHTAYCDAIKCEKWKTGCDKCPQIREYPKSYLDRSKRNWNRKKVLFSGLPNMILVTPSKWLAGLVSESFLCEYPVHVIHNGIDTSQFKPLDNDFKQHYGIEGKKMLLGVATNWNDNKGLSDYMKLADMIGEEYKVVLVGVTEEQKRMLPPSILGICRTNSVKELAYIYSAADVVLNLSKTENYPTIILEAASCDTPSVSYDVGGSGEIADVVVAKGDLEAVVEAVKKKVTKSGKLVSDKKAAANEYAKILVGGDFWQTRSKLGLLGHKVALGVAAVWDSRKGLSDIFKMEGCQVIVVGLSEKQKSRIPSHVIGYTKTNDVEELRKLYAIADVFVNPTYEDNFPSTNIEALACGTPVVTYRTGGSIEAAGDDTGAIINKGNYKMLNSNIRVSIDKCCKRSRLYTKEVMTLHYWELYKHITG